MACFADRDTQITRLMKRNNFSKEEAIARIDSQMSMDVKREKSTRIIYNLETIEKLNVKINSLLKDLS